MVAIDDPAALGKLLGRTIPKGSIVFEVPYTI